MWCTCIKQTSSRSLFKIRYNSFTLLCFSSNVLFKVFNIVPHFSCIFSLCYCVADHVKFVLNLKGQKRSLPYIFLISDRQWGIEHQYLFSGFLSVSIVQLLIIYRIYDYDMLTFCHSNSVNTGSRLPICSDVKTRKRRNVVGIDMLTAANKERKQI
jgi:hypothetical protein